MPLHSPFDGTPVLEGPRLVLHPLADGPLDAARTLLAELAPAIAPECSERYFVEGCLAAMSVGALDCWTVHEGSGPALGIAWLFRHPAPAGAPLRADAGLAWRPGMRRTPGFDAEVFLLLLREAFDARGFWSVTPRQPEPGTRERRRPAILRGEWPALRASLQARLAG